MWISISHLWDCSVLLTLVSLSPPFSPLPPGSGLSFCHLSLVNLDLIFHDRGNTRRQKKYFKQWKRKQLSVTLTVQSLTSRFITYLFFFGSVVCDSVSGQVQHSFCTSE